MSRVLLLCPEPLGERSPAGVGIRFLEMAGLLASGGREVTLLSPDGARPGEWRSRVTSPSAIAEESRKSDVANVQGHAVNDFIAHGSDVPLVVDLYDPYVVENLHYAKSHGGEVFTHDHATVMRSLDRGDFFLCASDSQRMFWCGMMLASGRLDPDEYASDPTLRRLIDVAPFGVAPPRHLRAEREPIGALLFGGIYDWYDPITAINAVARLRSEFPRASLTFNVHPNQEITPQNRAREAQEHAKRLHADYIRFEPWVAYPERGEFYDRHDLALLTFRPSLETDLAMRTRVLDYLWGGLPVVTSSSQTTDEIVIGSGSGIVVRESDPEVIAREVAELLSDRDRYESQRHAASRWAATHQWSDTLAPLLRFVDAPRSTHGRSRFVPAIGPIGARDPILARVVRRLRSLR